MAYLCINFGGTEHGEDSSWRGIGLVVLLAVLSPGYAFPDLQCSPVLTPRAPMPV